MQYVDMLFPSLMAVESKQCEYILLMSPFIAMHIMFAGQERESWHETDFESRDQCSCMHVMAYWRAYNGQWRQPMPYLVLLQTPRAMSCADHFTGVGRGCRKYSARCLKIAQHS